MLPFRVRLTVEDQDRGPVRRGPRVRRGKAPQTAHRWFGPGQKTGPLGRPRRPGGSPRPAARESRYLSYGIDPERAWRELEAFLPWAAAEGQSRSSPPRNTLKT